MNWLRATLRKWLVPEAAELEKATKKAKQELHEQVCRELRVIQGLQDRAITQLQGEMGALFFRFQGRKQIAVKDALKLLLTRLKLEIIVKETPAHELMPAIRRIGDKYPEEEASS